MSTYSFKCKNCGNRYTLKVQNVSALQGKTFRCAKCGFTVPFSVIFGANATAVQLPVNPLKTHIAGGAAMPDNNLKTRVAVNTKMAKLLVESDGRTLSLASGVNVLGRDSQDSAATVKVAPDPYMSRQHARLTVMPSEAGIIFRLSAMNSTNPVFVNNRKLNSGETVELRFGDTILLGMTYVKLCKFETLKNT